jgi:hypothetical protein
MCDPAMRSVLLAAQLRELVDSGEMRVAKSKQVSS